jgi:hypothetical protein
MANPPKNINDCRVGDSSQPPNPMFAFNGVLTNKNVQNNTYVPPEYCRGTLDYSTSTCAEIESNYIAGLMAETLQYAGGAVNIFPLLGVHNQGSTLDQPGAGYPLSSGTPSGYNALDGFNVNPESWRSIQTGTAVTSTPAFLGYDFGTKKAWDKIGVPQERYQPGAPVRHNIATVKIKQGSDPTTRALQVRIEASDDGDTWHRIDVANLPNTDQLVTIGVRSTAAYNKWRVVPTFFAGVTSNSPWEVVELHFLESTQLSLDNIEDFVLLENRDRAYCRSSIMLKCTYDLLDVQSELARFGISLPQTYIFTCSFADMVLLLGRPVVVGDIVELPGEVQYDTNLKPIRKWLEVNDTGWSTEGYTQNWKPNLFRFYAQPILPSVEHKDLLGVPGQVNAEQSDSDFLLSDLLQNQQAYESTEAITQISADLVPQTGEDPQDIQSGKPLIGPAGNYDGKDLYAQDAIPPNGEPFTIGDALPDPKTILDGHYHRQTYTNIVASLRPPERLLRWFANLQRWKVIEVNTRSAPESHKKTMAAILSSSTKTSLDSKL